MTSVLSQNCCSISIHELSLLEIDTLRTIISSESLRIENQDWLLWVLIELGDEYSTLFDGIRFEYLSEDGISFSVEHFQYDQMTETLWQGIIRRLENSADNWLQKSSLPSLMANSTT
jgi:hypothetical protein